MFLGVKMSKFNRIPTKRKLLLFDVKNRIQWCSEAVGMNYHHLNNNNNKIYVLCILKFSLYFPHHRSYLSFFKDDPFKCLNSELDELKDKD